ncbi:hypothetical protein [Actinoalloteichus hymeniacidonis]|uniref:Uncharacterized protein n=1 Tax=Actinoalloteichus hymeniacidonis TaxID=340345 RepID=A0AAC9HN10_9PSEU|nr:hypothetical protein [Actinoalloteichus hymeniacidonis]AOS62288.1 hypothetical protein TL08_07350 [Actinoalloteichus hymeniacidonis]MBB5909686.1 hypothetical protein [Actinoalloteichus hymeniacidonis]
MTERHAISEQLDEIVSTVEADPRLADRALTRGRQLRQTRRTVFGAVLALAVVLTAGTALTAWVRANDEAIVPAQESPAYEPPRDPSPELVERLTGEVRGDLAEDTAFIAEAESLWREQAADALSWTTTHHPQQTLTGVPNVHAAFTTPAGEVAIITQAVAGTRREAISGIVGPDEQGTTRVLRTTHDDGRLLSYVVGSEPGVLVVDAAWWGRVSMSDRVEVDAATGRPSREWAEIPLQDRIGIAALEPTSDPQLLTLSPLPNGNLGDGGPLGRQVQHAVPEGPRTAEEAASWDDVPVRRPLLSHTWSDEEDPPSPVIEVGEVDDRSLIDDAFMQVFGALGRTEVFGDSTTFNDPLAAFALPDGRTALVIDANHGPPAPHQYAVIFADGDFEEVVYGGPVDLDSTLPIAIRLPAEQGWAVFDHETQLRYRESDDGDWVSTGRSGAALLPDTATQVEVTDADGETEVVDLVG